MPTYSYACTECDNKFDAVQAFTDDALTTCPECSGRLRKLFNSVGVVFKGSGFYRTDSRESSKGTGDKPAGEKAASADTVATKTEKADKPAAATSGSGSPGSGSSSPAPATAS